MPVVRFVRTGSAPKDDAWNWDAATQNAILGPDGNDWSLYKQAHTWVDDTDGATPEKKAAYALPHHRASADGQLEAVWHGVVAALARLSQTDLPEADMRAAFDHLAAHYPQFDEDPPKWDRFLAQVQERRRPMTTPTTSAPSSVSAPSSASVRHVHAATSLPLVTTRATISTTVDRPNGSPTDGDLALINQMARREMKPTEVYVLPARISNQTVDAYYTRMTPKTLQQYAADATRGVAFLDSHEKRRLPMGRSYYGEVVRAEVGGVEMLTTNTLAYLKRGMPLSNGLNSDDIIEGAESGIYKDVSVGFVPQRFWCSVCNRDMLSDPECYHVPGYVYQDDMGREVQCVADVDASLAEYSLVYEGATPGAELLTPNAMTLKAEREIALGRADVRALRMVEDRCRVRLLDRFAGFGPGLGAGLGGPGANTGDPQTVRDSAPRDLMSTTATTTATTATGARGDHGPLPAGGGEESEHSMDGAQFVQGVIDRAGREISEENMTRLKGVLADMQSGHGSLSDAMTALARMVAEKDTKGDDGQTDAAEDGKMPTAEDGNHAVSGRAAETPDLQTPAQTPDLQTRAVDAGGKASKPGTDDGDGDDDAPTRAEEEEDEDGDRGTRAAEPSGDPQGVDAGSDTHGPVHTGAAKHAHGKYGDHSHADDANHDSAPLKEGRDAPAESPSVPSVPAPAPERTLSEEERELIEAGRLARESLITEIVQDAARALGGVMDEVTMRTLLGNARIGELRLVRDRMREQAKLELSPRGHWVEDRSFPEGGYWTKEPTGTGGRQTAARDPNDPMGVLGAGARVLRKGSRALGEQEEPSPLLENPALYRANPAMRRSGHK